MDMIVKPLGNIQHIDAMTAKLVSFMFGLKEILKMGS